MTPTHLVPRASRGPAKPSADVAHAGHAGHAADAQRDLPDTFRLGRASAIPNADGAHVDVVLLGLGAIGRELLTQLGAAGGARGAQLRVCAVLDTSGYLLDPAGISRVRLAEVVRLKASGRPLTEAPGALAAHAATAVDAIAGSLGASGDARPVLVDATAADTGTLLESALGHGWDVVLANKIPLAAEQARVDRLRRLAHAAGRRVLHEATVGAGLPVIDTLCKLLDAGDEVHSIEGCPSGTLGFLFAELGRGHSFSAALRGAVGAGLTEPDPRIDLSGLDVARKALILARLIGFRGELADVAVESLIPASLATLPVKEFLQRVHELDAPWRERVERVRAEGKVLRYRIRVTRRAVVVGLVEVHATDALGALHGTDNQFAFTTARYRDRPLVIAGPGAGAAVTAAGVFGDLLQLAPGRQVQRPLPASRRAARGGVPQVATPAFEVSGPAGAPLVVAMGGISASRHVVATADDPSSGWWEGVAGPGRALDTRRYRVLGIDFLDGGRAADGRPARTVTTHDQADALAAALDALGEGRVHAIVGASYGGMVALAFAERYPARVARLVVLSAAHESHPMSTGLRALQRRIVELGLDTGRSGDALALARGVAMTTYRTAREFGERFAPARASAPPPLAVEFEVERYLDHSGRRFAATFPAERFLALSLSADLHRVDPAAVRVPALLVAAEGDTLVPESQLAELAARAGAPSRLVRMPTRYGHDAFLTEPTKVGRILAAALRGQIPSEVPA